MYTNLVYRRQFLLSRAPVSIYPDWKCLQIDHYLLYVHPDLDVNQVTDQQQKIVLLGNIYSPTEPEKNSHDILSDIIANICNLEGLFLFIKRYAGRYVLLYIAREKTIILNDPLSLREVYFCTEHNDIICGSQPNLILEYARPNIKSRRDPDFLEYYNAHSISSKWNPNIKWIGDETYYDGIMHLLPNHYFDIGQSEVRRYWPNEPIKELDIEDAISKICSFLQKSIRAIARRHSLMMAVTAGWDSRTLLAATKDIKNEVYFFINNEGLGYDHPDIAIPKKFFEKLAIPFHIHEIPSDVDNEFRSIFLNNTFFASERILSTIYNIYFKNHQDKTNILGIGEIGRTRFGKEPKKVDRYRIAYKMGHKQSRYAMKQGVSILRELLPVSRKYNLICLRSYTGNIGSEIGGQQGILNQTLRSRKLTPMTAVSLYELYLGIDAKYANYYKNELFKRIINKMWPELLRWPINPPPNSIRDRMTHHLKKWEFFRILRRLSTDGATLGIITS